jgi:TRAP-type C4-dicarboxylate transport system permease large subunit
MIADSPYEARELVLTPKMGLVAGFLAAILMLIFIYLVQPISGFTLRNVLTQIGDVLLPNFDTLGIYYQLLSGVFFNVLLGILYSLSQQTIPRRGLIFVGLFYGFILWLIIGIIVGWMTGDEARGVFHSWLWLLSCFLYGFCLASVATWSGNRRQKSTKIALPKD